MEVIRNASSTVSPLAKLRGEKEEFLQAIDSENSRIQSIIRIQNDRRQIVMIFCVLGAFFALLACFVRILAESYFASLKAPVTLIMILFSLFFLFLAVINYPSSMKYKGTWKNYKKAKPYEDMILISIRKKKKYQRQIHEINDQLKIMENQLYTVSQTDIP